MISVDEIRRSAGKLGLDPTVIDHDYVIGCFLHHLANDATVQRSWIFKGGTSLQKCHFGSYRFSEDLDFTLRDSITADGIRDLADRVKNRLQESTGIRTDEVPTRIEMLNDDYGRESIEVRIYYRGPWDFGGSPRSLQLHLSRDEIVIFNPLSTNIIHNYSDRGSLPGAPIITYSLEEILVEKLRAFSGQRRFAIARDVFDIYHVLTREIDRSGTLKALKEKCEVKGIDVQSIDASRIETRKAEYLTNWDRNLVYLVPPSLLIPFDSAWTASTTLVNEAIEYHRSIGSSRGRAG